MQKELFSAMEIDALGEMINISLGSSATAVSNMLDHRVDITTPKVSVVKVDDFTLGDLEPAMGVEIKYVEGLEGSNIMLLRRSDIKVIVDILMGMESDDSEFELNELTISAVCEVMNQMMGAASTAMSDFLGFPVNISTPEPFDLDNLDDFKQNHLAQGADTVVAVRFSLKIEDALESEFMNVMPVHLAKELLRSLGLEVGDYEEDAPEEEAAPAPAPESADGSNKQMSQAEIEAMMSGMAGGEPAPASAPEPAGGSNKQMTQAEIEAMMSGMAGGEPAPAAESEPAGGSNKQMTQAEIEAMMSGMAGGEPAPASAPESTGGSNKQMSQAEIEAMMSGMAGGGSAPAPAPTSVQAAAPAQAPVPPQAAPQMPYPQGMPMPGMAVPPGYMPYYYPYPPAPPQAMAAVDPKVINTQPVNLPKLEGIESLGKEQAENLDLIMEVPLQITVEIGRTRRKVQDILEFTKGSLVVLDKLAGDQVDLFVNGKCVAKGDVVVIDDNFGVRITEIVRNPSVADLTGKKN